MPLTDSMEKPPAAERTAGPIAVFSNSYARLPEHFFARRSPTAVAKAPPDQVQRIACLRTGRRYPRTRTGRVGGGIWRERHSAGRRADRDGLCRAPIRQFRSAARRRPRNPPWRGRGPQRRAARYPIEGRGPNAVLPAGRWPRCIGPVLREYLVSEAMHALGIPTTRALAAVSTGETVFRDRQLPGAVLTRVASSHIRIGTFQYFAARGDMEAVEHLSGYVIDRHFPEARASERPILALLQIVVERQALLVARWMHVGFIHGVMNTDNTALSGETIDFGPCAFIDLYDPATTFSAIDELGRYAYGNQPTIAHWNLARFAETLLPLLDPNPERAVELANEAISTFTTRFHEHWLVGMRDKLGLSSNEEGDLELAHALLRAMYENAADFTLTFRRLCDAAADEKADADVRALFANPAAYDSWVARWRSRLAAEELESNARARAMRSANPAFIPRNHRVEQALDAAIEYGDFSPFAELLTVLSRPYEDQAAFADYANPPHADERVFRTFCGT